MIQNYIGFALHHFVIGPEELHRFLNQSDAKLKPSLNWSNMFSALAKLVCLNN